MKTKIFNAVCKTRYLALLVVLIFTCGKVWGADPITQEWILTSTSSDFTSNGCVLYFSQPYGMKKADAYIQAQNLTDFKDYASLATQIDISVKCLQNGGSTSRLTIYLIDKNGTTLGSSVVTPDNYSSASSTTYKTVSFTSSLTNATGFKVQCTTFGKNILINGAKYSITYTAAPAYTITATRNNDSYGTVSVTGTTITATPNSGYRVKSGTDGYTVTSGTATVVNNGDNTFTVTPSSNCTVRINFESKGCTDHGASSITSGASTDDDYGPVCAYNNYSTRQILYTKTDLDLAAGKKGTIKSIYFEYSGAAAMAARTIEIFMANTALTALSAGNCVPYASFTQVYSGTFSCGSAGWYEITLDTPFDYNGIGNLVVLIDDNTGSWASSKNFKYHSVTSPTPTNVQIYYNNDGTNINPSTTDWSNFSATNNRPNTKFCIQEADMTPATVTLMDNGATITEPSAGAGVTLPSRAGCTGYTFTGWTKTWTEEQDEWTTTAPTIIQAGSYTPTGNENLYPVYTQTKSGGSPEFSHYQQVALGGTITAGKYLISTGSYTMAGSGKTGVSLTPSTTEAAAREYTVAIVSGTTITIKGPDNKYIGGLDKADGLTFDTSTPSSNSYRWVYTENGIQNKSITGRHIKAYNTTDFRHYGTANGTLTYFYKRIETAGTTTYYISVPDCCTDPETALSITGSSTVAMDGTLSLGTSGGNGNTVTWSVATLSGGNGSISSSGVLTPSAVGTVTVTARQAANSQCAQEATLTVTITSATVNVTGVTLDHNSAALLPEETFQLTATVSPNNATDKSVTWNSDTPAKATVSNTGLVAAVAKGSSTVTVTTTNGRFTANCAVTVHGISFLYQNEAGETITGVSANATGKSISASEGSTNYKFKEWSYGTSSGMTGFANSENASTTMTGTPTGDVVVIATFRDPITVAWKVGNDNASGGTTEVKYGTKISTLPTTPADDALSSCGTNKFMGWSTSEITTTGTNTPPADLFTAASGASNLTTNTTYHAVFAKSSGGGGAAVNTTLWAEDFSGWSDGNVPSGNYTNSHTGTTVYGGATVTYACVDGGSQTKLYGGNNTLYAGGVKPELLVGKSTGTFTVSGIPDGGASEITVSYKQNNKTLAVTASGTGYSGSATNTPASATTESFDVTVSSGAGGTFTLTFAATSSDNARMDDILVKVKTQGVSYSEYLTACAACAEDPTEGSAALKGGFSLTSVGVTATDWDPGTNCTWDEKGFVWGSSANPTVSNNKVTVNTGTSATWDGALVPSGSTDPTSLSVGNTYHYRAYGKNGKEGATYVYSSDASFTPRSVTCESVTGGTISAGTEVSVSGKTITLTATPDSHFSFGSWTVTNNSTSATITVTNNQFTMPDANVTVTATFNEDAYKTVTFYNNSTNTGITGYTNMKVYVGDTPSEPTLTDGTSGDACDATSDKHYGWSRDTWSDPIDTEAHMTGSPGNHTVYQKGSVPAVVDGDPATISYHAVWAAGSQYWGRLTSSELSGLSAGTELVIVAVDQGYVLKNDLTCSSSVPVETDGKITPTDDIKWALAGSSGAWQLKSGTDILGTLYANCAGSGNGLALNFNTNFQTYSIASSSHGTNEFYIKANDCTEGVLTKVSKYDNFRVVTTSNYSSAASAALKLYIKKGSYSEFITKCCNTPTLAFAASPYAMTRQNKDQLNVADVLENISFSSNSSGTITAGTVYKLSSYGSRSTTGGTAAVAAHATFVLDDQTKGHFTVNTNSTSGNGRGTYRIAITQAATDEDHGNYCETTVYAFVDVTLRFLFVDPLNSNANITIDDTGSGITFPTISSWATPDDDACHSEQRVLKGWISEKSLKSLYNSSTRVINLDDIEAADDAASKTGLQRTVVPPGTVMSAGSTLYTQGTKWYAVWAYEK